jgi:hypothetical protein
VPHRFQHRENALVGRELSKKTKPPAGFVVARLAGRGRRRRGPAVRFVAELVARDAPGGITLEQETAGAKEQVDVRELGLDETLAEKKFARRDVWKAFMTPPR